MKKYFLMSVFVVTYIGLSIPTTYGQSFYTGFDAGYGLKIPSSINNWNYDNISSINAASTHDKINFSLGKGLYIGLTGGYKISEIASVELNVSCLSGSPVKANNKATDTAGTYYVDMNYSMKAGMVYLNPAFQISMSPEKKFNPYAKFGIIFGFGKLNETINGMYYTGEYWDMNIVYRDGHALGFSSSLGVVYKVSDLLNVFCEARLNALSYSPNKNVLTKFTKDGADQLASMPVYDKEVIYVDAYNTQNGPIDDTKPREMTKSLYSLYSYGLHIGLRFNL